MGLPLAVNAQDYFRQDWLVFTLSSQCCLLKLLLIRSFLVLDFLLVQPHLKIYRCDWWTSSFENQIGCSATWEWGSYSETLLGFEFVYYRENRRISLLEDFLSKLNFFFPLLQTILPLQSASFLFKISRELNKALDESEHACSLICEPLLELILLFLSFF